jgi:hypothetical protein
LNASGRQLRRAVAATLSLALLGLHPALADEAPPPDAPDSQDAPVMEGAEELPPEEAVSPIAEYGAKAFDVFPIRILSACATVVGFGAFVVSVPLVAPGGRLQAIRDSWDYFVMGPVDYTFVRPLGEF